jgi:tetratricopeptide (TPR) repeat protein
MADHGESLGAHGEDTHGIFLYDETIQVPLVIKLPRGDSPGKLSAGKRIESRVELVDVLPTILQAAGVEVPREVQGESLLTLIKEGAAEGNVAADSWHDRPAYAQADYPHIAYGWSALQSLRTGKYLYIQAPQRELYEEAADPKAEHNLASASAAVADTLAGKLQAFRQKTSSKREAPAMAADPAAQEKLAALGYVASSNVSKAGTIGQGTDPKDNDNIETVKVIRRVNSLLEDQRVNDAIPALQHLIAKNADISILYFKLGDCYMKLHEYDKAVLALRHAVELAPASMMARMNLGLALVQVQDFAAAVPEFENVVAMVPRSEQAHLLLATAYSRTDRMPDAIKECGKVLEVSPDNYGANLLLGRVLVLSGDPAAALPKLKKAAALQPKASEPHLALSNAYLRLGRDADAARELVEAKRLVGGRAE